MSNNVIRWSLVLFFCIGGALIVWRSLWRGLIRNDLTYLHPPRLLPRRQGLLAAFYGILVGLAAIVFGATLALNR